VTRKISFTTSLSILLSTTSKIGTASWGGNILSSTDWTRMSVLYQEFRLRKVVTRFLPCPFYSTSAGTQAVSGCVAHDPTSDVTTGGSVYDFLDLPRSRIFGADTDVKWHTLSITNAANLKSGVELIHSPCSIGLWLSVDHLADLIGQTIFSAEQPGAWTYTANQTALKIIQEYYVDFRMPIEYDISGKPEIRLSELKALDERRPQIEEKKSSRALNRPTGGWF